MNLSPVTHTFFEKNAGGSYVAVVAHNFCTKSQIKGLFKDLDALMAKGQVLKKGATSDVSRIFWNNTDIVVKRYNHGGIFHSLRHTIKGSRAAHSWQCARRLESLDAITTKPLAYIEQRKHEILWQSWLITEYINGQRLDIFLCNDEFTEQQRLEMFRNVVQILETLWNNRITHGDLKHTNILITPDGPVLTDLDAMMLHRCSLTYIFKRSKDIRRFFRKTDFPQSIYKKCRTIMSDIERPFDEHSKRFTKVRYTGWSILIDEEFPENKIADIIHSISVSDNCSESFTKVPSSDYARVFKYNISLGDRDQKYFLKRYLFRSKLDFIKHIFRPSRAKRAFYATLMLQKNRFDAPDVIGLLERHSGLLCTENLLLAREVANAMPLPKYLDNICRQSGKNALAKKRSFIRAFARTIGCLHNKGIFHGDLRLNNVLVVPDGTGEKFYFIDNERTKKYFRIPERLRLKNLVQINMLRKGISNSDRIRFFKTYVGKNIDIQNRFAVLIKKITTKTFSRLNKKGLL